MLIETKVGCDMHSDAGNSSSNFELKESFASYVSLSDPESLSVSDRLPRKIVWSFQGNRFELECSSGLIAKKFNANILLIEAPYDIKANRAFILTADNRLVADLPKKLDGLSPVYYDILPVLSADNRLVADLPKKSGSVSLYYYDILLRTREVIFLASSSNGDFQLKIDPVTGSVMSIQEFR